jgi:hypothetical protein
MIGQRNALMRILFSALAISAIALVAARAAEDQPTAADRDAVTACLTLASERAQNAPEEEPNSGADAAAWLDRAGRQAASSLAGCIGVVATPCADNPENRSTFGMADCANRETAVWDERLNKSYQEAGTVPSPLCAMD